MRVGVVQMTSTDEVAANLEAARTLVASAVRQGAELVALPENFAYLHREGTPIPCAQGLDGEIVGSVRALAKQHGVWILGGTFPEAAEGEPRVYNTSVLVSPSGEIEAVYRKIHLFEIDFRASGGEIFRESDTIAPGRDVVVADTPFGAIGLSVCYDLRFPELYRAMAARGARWIAVPSAFTPQTGKDHWEILLRARRLHTTDRQGPLGGPATCAGDREPGLRAGAGPVRPPQRRACQLWPFDDPEPLGPGARPGGGPALRAGRRLRPRRPGANPGGPPGAPASTALEIQRTPPPSRVKDRRNSGR
jgi:predicted amidohydrolase